MIVANVMRQLKAQAAEAAARRWAQRAAARQGHDALLRRFGAGAADTPERQARMATRENARAVAAHLMHTPAGLRLVERIVGPTDDIVPLAPSEAARKAGAAVARLVLRRDARYEPVPLATGFLVTPRLLLTNHHVLPTAADAVGVAANFQYEQDEAGVRAGSFVDLDPATLFLSDKRLDFALVAIRPGADATPLLRELGVIKMIEATPKTSIGAPANIIQHPDGRPKAYAFLDNRIVDILDDGFIHYRTDTRPGSSGSPVFSDKWELIALHHCGIPSIVDGVVLDKRGNPWDPERQSDDEIEWIANEGVRVSSLVGAIRGHRPRDARERDLLDEFAETTADPLALVAQVGEAMAAVQPARVDATAAGGESRGAAMNVFNIQGPTTINIYNGVAAPTAVQDKPAGGLGLRGGVDVGPLVAEKKQNFDEDYAARAGQGYDSRFLSVAISHPSAPARADELLTNDDGTEWVLDYHHYSLVMNRERRLMMWSAANVSYDLGLRDTRTRGDLGAENWREDPRIAERFGDSFQITDTDFYGPATRIDRGHIVRREDNCWGDSPLMIEYANADTYHWTNCTPQHEAFNRENPGSTADPHKRADYAGRKGTWGWFEAFVQQSLKTIEGNRASIFAGPMLKGTDPTPKQGSAAVRSTQYPVRFWKVLAVVAAPGAAGNLKPTLMVYGFIFDQSDVISEFGLGIKEAKASDFRNYQATLREISEESGVEFDDVLHEHDVFAKVAGRERVRRIRTEEDVVVQG
jgi:endonuclease G, mitochondrial